MASKNIPAKYRAEAYGGVEYDTRYEYVGPNGDLRKKPNPERWTGNSDMDDIGFMSRGVTSTSGTNKPDLVKPVKFQGAIQPIPKGHRFEPVIRPQLDPEVEAMRQSRLDHAEEQRQIAAAKHRARARNLYNNEG